MKPFAGIMYSRTTDIFYKLVKGKLFRFGVYKDSTNPTSIHKWVPSEFQDYNGRSSTWIKATPKQIKEFSL